MIVSERLQAALRWRMRRNAEASRRIIRAYHELYAPIIKAMLSRR